MSKSGATKAEHYHLRPMTLEVIPTLADWFEDLSALSLFDRRAPLPPGSDSLRESWRPILEQPEPKLEYWFVINDRAGNAVGIAGIIDINYAQGNAVIPMYIDGPQRAKGIGRRTQALLLDLAFDQLRMARMTSLHDEGNEATAVVNLSCGFKEEGRMRRAAYTNGVYSDRLIYGLLAEEWREVRPRLAREWTRGVTVGLGSGDGGKWVWPPLPDGVVAARRA